MNGGLTLVRTLSTLSSTGKKVEIQSADRAIETTRIPSFSSMISCVAVPALIPVQVRSKTSFSGMFRAKACGVRVKARQKITATRERVELCHDEVRPPRATVHAVF